MARRTSNKHKTAFYSAHAVLEAAADAFAEVLEALGGILFVGKNEKLGRQSADDLEFNVVTDHL